MCFSLFLNFWQLWHLGKQSHTLQWVNEVEQDIKIKNEIMGKKYVNEWTADSEEIKTQIYQSNIKYIL